MSVWQPVKDASIAATNAPTDVSPSILRESTGGITYQQEAAGGVLRDVETRRVQRDELTNVAAGEHVLIVDTSTQALTPAVNAGGGYAQPVNDGTLVAYGGDRPDVPFEAGNFVVGGPVIPETQPINVIAVGSTDNIIVLPEGGQGIETQSVGSVGLPEGGIGWFNGENTETLG